MYQVDYTRNAEHEEAVHIAERAVRPFSRYFVIGRPVTFNADFLPQCWQHSIIRHPDFKRQRKNRLAANIRKRQRRLKRMLGAGMLFCMAILPTGVGRGNAQSLPDEPAASLAAVSRGSSVQTVVKHHAWMTRAEMRDADELAFVNYGDYQTTEHFLAHGGREVVLPTWLVESKPEFAVYKAATAGSEILAEHVADRAPFVKRHRVARWAVIAGVQFIVAETAKVDVDNIQCAKHLEKH